MISTPLRIRNLTIPFDPIFTDWTASMEDGRRVYVTWRIGEIRVQAFQSDHEWMPMWETILVVPAPEETVISTENMLLMTGMEVVTP